MLSKSPTIGESGPRKCPAIHGQMPEWSTRTSTYRKTNREWNERRTETGPKRHWNAQPNRTNKKLREISVNVPVAESETQLTGESNRLRCYLSGVQKKEGGATPGPRRTGVPPFCPVQWNNAGGAILLPLRGVAQLIANRFVWQKLRSFRDEGCGASRAPGAPEFPFKSL